MPSFLNENIKSIDSHYQRMFTHTNKCTYMRMYTSLLFEWLPMETGRYVVEQYELSV